VITDFFTTEAQRPQRRLCFPWPGDDGQGKKLSPEGERFFVSELTATSESNAKSRLPGGLGSFARSPSPDRAKIKFALCSLCLCG
jgi:hypothetical protein